MLLSMGEIWPIADCPMAKVDGKKLPSTFAIEDRGYA
jgi:hypothetical protein